MSSSREPFAQMVAHGSSKHDPRLRLHTPAPDAGEYTPEPNDPRQYQALRTSSRRPPRLRIRCHTQPGHSLPYSALLDVIIDEQFGGCFSLVFHHQVVHVTGRYLVPVAEAISDQRAAVLTLFDAQRFDIPASDAPVIEGVEFEGGAVMEEVAGRAAEPANT
jgi:hypothetical protein